MAIADLKKALIGLSGGGFKLAPALNYPSTITSTTNTFQTVTINPVGVLTTALSLTGRFAISFLVFRSLTAEPITVKLTIDGEVIWDSTFVTQATLPLLVGGTSNVEPSPIIICESSFLLEIQTTTDNSVTFDYAARPIQ